MTDNDRREQEQDAAIANLREVSASDGGSFFGQFSATVVKNIQQKKEAPCSCCLEFSLPILFVIGTVLIWSAFSNTTSPWWESGSMNYSKPYPQQTFASNIADNVCYDDGNGYTIAGMNPCSGKTYQTTCAGKAEGLIRDGFCWNNDASTFNAVTQVYTLMTSWVKTLQLIPSLRTVIQLQWLGVATGLTRKRVRRSGYHTGLAAMSSTGYLYFAPKSAATDALVSWLNATEPMFTEVYGGTYTTVAKADDWVSSLPAEGRNWGIVVVDAISASAFNVRIRLNASAMPKTNLIISEFYFGGVGSSVNGLYLISGFLSIQEAITRYYLTQIKSVAVPPTATFVGMPYPSFTDHVFLSATVQLVPLVIVLGFMYTVSQMTKRIVMEKELRIREAMMIMGLGSSSFYMSWFLTYALQSLFVSIICTILLQITYLKNSSFLIIFFCFFLFALSNIALAGVMSAFFSRSRIAALLSPIIFLAFSLPLFAAESLSPQGKRGLLLLSPSAFAMGISRLFEHEIRGGLGPDKVDFFRDDPTMLTVLFLLGFDTVLYVFIMLYVDAIMPNEWGTPRHPLFFIVEPFRYLTRNSNESDQNDEDGRDHAGAFEALETSALGTPTVRIAGLRKTFVRAGEPFVAVDNLHWQLYDSQISVLLGHNGAGKSTAINLMTGMLPIDKGDCFIYGKSVRHQLSAVRREIGFCPQHNVLWPELTCAQHLKFYASIKGVKSGDQEEAIDSMLKAVDLFDKKDYPSTNLSGGQKRKLSVAIAFIGGSRLVFLDEPTAGMDVGARRHTWDLIKRMSVGRTIVLTTHYMDEADLLGHQIAIMSKGSMKCCGSSVFLKSRLGVGYNVTMSVIAHADTKAIDQAVRQLVPSCTLLSSGAGEISYRLPSGDMTSFPTLLQMLENDGKRLGVQAFAVSATTLEEIFLQVAHSMDEKSGLGSRQTSVEQRDFAAEQKQPRDTAEVEMRETSTSPVSNGVWNVRREEDPTTLFFSQLRSVLKKRWANAKRDKRTICLQVVSPIVCILLAMLFTLLNFIDQPSIALNSNVYGTNTETVLQNCDGVLFTAATPFGNGISRISPSGLTGGARGLSKYLLANSMNHTTERYSAMACRDADLASALGLADVSLLFYNFSGSHEMPITYNTYAQNYARRAASDATLALNILNQPMNPTGREASMVNMWKSTTIGIIILVPFSFIPSVFVSWIVKEKECKARHLQNVSGLGFAVYWIGNFIFDIVSFLLTELLAIVVFAIFNREEYIGGGASVFFAMFTLFFIYGISSIGVAYVVSFLFEEHSAAQNIVMLVNFVCGFLLVLLVMILKIVESTSHIGKGLTWPCRIIPAFAVGDGIISLSIRKSNLDFGLAQSAWDLDVVGYDLLYMGLEIPLLFLFVLFWDHPRRRQAMQRRSYQQQVDDEVAKETQQEDEDVARERGEIEDMENNSRKGDLVTVRNMRKVYANGKVAVRNMTFGVRPGEVFGFLGTNGAGKTTAISILCQEFLPSNGQNLICGYDIVSQSTEALRCIGYCPQFDAVLDLLTVEEHLFLYAGIRGIVEADQAKIVASLSALCELRDYMGTVACELSGGNRRKLSVALSLIGGPQVVFLDEPSAGMDPVARRGLWTAVQTVADNCAVVLTTHHLEEVEALAHRVAIMVDGSLRCIGDKTHLKSKYGSGFEMTFRIASEATYQASVDFITQQMPTARLNEYRSLHFTYALPQDTKLSAAFGLVEAHKARLGITDYSIAQTSIEQVFLRISEAAIEAQEMERLEKEEQAKQKKQK